MPNLTEYKCPSCGSTLAWHPEKEKLTCASCGNEFDLEAVQAFMKSEETGESFDWGNYRKEMENNEQLEDVNVYICESCGAAIETDKNTVATAERAALKVNAST